MASNNHESALDAFIALMQKHGCEPKNHSDIVADDVRHLIAMAGDKGGEKRLYYRVAINGDFAFGWFKDCRNGETTNFSHKSGDAPISKEEKETLRKAREEAKEIERQERDRRHAINSSRFKKVLQRLPIAKAHPYLDKKGIAPNGIRLRPKKNELIIPLYGIDGTLNGLQKVSLNWKGYVKNSKSQGSYYPLAKSGEDLSTLIIAEGFATGATVRAATDLPVIVAFDSGNLMPVIKALKVKYPGAIIIIAADSDQWTFDNKKRPDQIKAKDVPGDDPRWELWRNEGRCYNVGVDKARQAASAIGGAFVLSPPFKGDEHDKPTDWNDLAKIRGIEYVKKEFNDALARVPKASAETQEAPHGIQDSPIPDVQAVGSSYDSPEDEDRAYVGDFQGMRFKVLGYNNGLYYYFPFHARQIVALSASSHSIQNLLQIDNLEAWQHRFGGHENTSPAKIALYAANAMMQVAKERGVFQEEDRVRGCGAWLDDNRIILHCGNILYVDGERRNFNEVNSHYTYVAAAKLMEPASIPLRNAEAHKLREICEMVTWENKLSGSLLAGWLVVAPICASLDYRPHIYLTGEAESGKSTVFNKIIKPVIGKIGLFVDGGTTEPAIRDMMGYDGRPLILDEGENSNAMLGVIELARKASTGSVVKKFGQRAFKARFAACFSAINPPVNKTADESRISFMVIKKNRKATAMQEYEDMLTAIDECITPDFSSRLLARTLANMDSLQKNITIFQKAFRRVTGGARASQQIGTMLAGLYLLSRTDIITAQAAEEWVKSYQWNDHTIIDQESDPIRLVQHIAGCLIRKSNGSEEAVGDLINIAMKESDKNADNLLRKYGIAVKDERVYIANRSQNLERLLKNTEWGMKWGRTLGEVEGATKERIVYFSAGIRTSAVSLPMSLFNTDDMPLFQQDSEPPSGYDREEPPQDDYVPHEYEQGEEIAF